MKIIIKEIIKLIAKTLMIIIVTMIVKKCS